jgi:iduronate 2-sulfatase
MRTYYSPLPSCTSTGSNRALLLLPDNDTGLPDNQFAPVGMPDVAWSNYEELRGQYADARALHSSGAINSTLPPAFTRSLRQHYYGAVSYLDSNIGQVLGVLQASGQDGNTIKILWGDHGYQVN